MPIPQELIKKIRTKVEAEIKFEFRESDDYGTLPESVKDSFGEISVRSHCEPEDAIWGRDLSANWVAGLSAGVRNTTKVLKENPELLKELLTEVK